MRGKIGHTTDGITLNLHIWAEHLPDERLKTAEFHDEKLVVSCRTTSVSVLAISPECTHYLQQGFQAPHLQPAALRCHGC